METASFTTRRTFLAQVSALGLGGVASLGQPSSLFGATGDPGDGTAADLASATSAVFRPAVGTTFRLSPATGKPVDVELIQAKDLPLLPPQGKKPVYVPRRRGFSLLFRGPKGAALPQNSYALEHAQLGQFTLFLVPLGPGKDRRMRYEAILN